MNFNDLGRKLNSNLILASSNQGKISEFNELFAELNINIKSQAEFAITGAEETGVTFIENAMLKARHASLSANLPAIADDSGLVVDALNGKPGVLSARYAGLSRNDSDNNQKLLKDLEKIPTFQRNAYYHCTLVYITHANDPDPLIFQGRWYGSIATECSGTGGFGYDPLFYLTQYQCTVAELNNNIKNRLSHRAIAVAKLKQHFFA